MSISQRSYSDGLLCCMTNILKHLMLFIYNKYLFNYIGPRLTQSSSVLFCGVRIMNIPLSSSFFQRASEVSKVLLPPSLTPSLLLAKTGRTTNWFADLCWSTKGTGMTCDVWHMIPPFKSMWKSWNLWKKRKNPAYGRHLISGHSGLNYFCFVLNKCHVSCATCYMSHVLCHLSHVTNAKS